MSKVFVIVFLIVFFLIGGIMVKGMMDQQKKNIADNNKYTQMIHEGEKTKLTQEILDQDHAEYVESVKSNNNTFAIIGIAFIGLMVLLIVIFTVQALIRKSQGASGLELIRYFIPVGCLAVFTILGIIIGVQFIAPSMKNDKYEKESYKYVELNIKTTQVEEHKSTHRRSGSSHGTTTTTTYTYFLITDDDQKIQVSKILYERFDVPGIYYAGQTESGSVFSLYPDKYFELG